MLICKPMLIWAIGSAEDLPTRIRANPRGLRPVLCGSAGCPPKIFSGALCRRSAERPADSGGVCTDTGGSAANWRKSSLEKCLPTKTSLTPRFPRKKFRCGRLSAAEILVGSELGLGLWYSNPNHNLNPNPNLNQNPNLNPNPNFKGEMQKTGVCDLRLI